MGCLKLAPIEGSALRDVEGMNLREVLQQFDSLCSRLAKSYRTVGVDLEDLEQEARLAVLEHAASYQPEMGVSMQTFLGRRIRDALRKYLVKSLDLVESARYWEARHISGDETKHIRTHSKVECERVLQDLDAREYSRPRRVDVKSSRTVSFDEVLFEDEEGYGVSRGDLIGEEPTQFAHVEAEEKRRLQTKVSANRIIAVKKEAESQGKDSNIERIVSLRAQGLTQKKIAEALGISQPTVSLALSKLKKRPVA